MKEMIKEKRCPVHEKKLGFRGIFVRRMVLIAIVHKCKTQRQYNKNTYEC